MPNLLNEAPGPIAFVRTVEAGSFSAAARGLKTTPSSISRGIARLEKHVGSRLFLRSTRALTLTPDGQEFFDRLAPLLKEIDSADERIQGAAGAAGRLRVSLPGVLGGLLTRPLLSKFVKSNPAIQLELGITDRSVDLIREDYDVVFRIGGSAQGDLIVRKLAQLDMVLVVSPAFVAEHGMPETMSKLRQLPFARYSIAGRPQPVRFADGTEFLPSGSVDCDSGHALHAAALEGIGISHLLRCVVAADLAAGRLVELLPNGQLAPVGLVALHAFGRTVPSRVSLLCTFIAEEVKSLPL